MATYLRPVTVAINGKRNMFLLSLLLNRFVIGLLVSLGLVAGGYFAKHSYDNGKREEGRAEMKAKLQPQIDSAVAALAESSKAMAALKESSEKLKKQAEAEQTANAGRRTVEKTRIEYIDRVVPTGATECERTSDAIKKVLR